MLNILKEMNNITTTENGDVTYKSTLNGIMDLYALGGAYRGRSEDDVIFLFKKAFDEDPTYALKCLFYLRDIRGGAGERRFFRVVIKYLAKTNTEVMRRNMKHIPEFGRWDDLYALVGTPLEKEMFNFLYQQLSLDIECKTPSLLAKWLKSENTSSNDSRRLGKMTRKAFKLTSKQYRVILSTLRARINVLERLMSANRWDEIEFDKIPSKAGLIYRNAFARRDIIKEKYRSFMMNENTAVNAGALNPCDVVQKVMNNSYYDFKGTDVERAALNKYWDNLTDYFNGSIFDGVAVVDTSGSMCWSHNNPMPPLAVAISLGMYCAEKCAVDSPWYGHYISFSRTARLVPVEGVDFCDKVARIKRKNLCENTNIRSVFDLLLNTAKTHNLSQDRIPKNVIIISDMEFDSCTEYRESNMSGLETIAKEWAEEGYEMPHLVFWNVNARNDRIPMRDNGRVTFISGYSATLFEQLMSGKSGWDLVKEKLDSERYACIA